MQIFQNTFVKVKMKQNWVCALLHGALDSSAESLFVIIQCIAILFLNHFNTKIYYMKMISLQYIFLSLSHTHAHTIK